MFDDRCKEMEGVGDLVQWKELCICVCKTKRERENKNWVSNPRCSANSVNNLPLGQANYN